MTFNNVTIFATPQYLKDAGYAPEVKNAYVVMTDAMTEDEEKHLSQELLDTKKVLNVGFMNDQIEKQATMAQGLEPVVLIFIVLSGVLAFVVLYNLTTINISERERELATIKVLGFYDKEVTMCILRENIVFTIFGILLGYVIGNVITRFLLSAASSDLITFPHVISWEGYVIETIMTCLFSVVVSVVTHSKLRNIDMIRALKSSE